jgi:adenylate kinase family enzyme
VLGPSGAGKTCFSTHLSKLLGIEAVHLDAYFWKPGWVATAEAEWRAVVSALVRKPSWVMDGTYERTLDLRVPAADAVILLERPRLLCLWGVVRRCLFARDRHDAPPGQKVDRAFFNYIWNYPTVTRPLVLRRLREYGPDKGVIVLRGRRGARRFLEAVREHRGGPGRPGPLPPTGPGGT